MGRPPARIDILMSLQGVGFADAWPRRITSDFDGVPAAVIGRDELITNKRTVGRPQDLMDLANLLESARTSKPPGDDEETP